MRGNLWAIYCFNRVKRCFLLATVSPIADVAATTHHSGAVRKDEIIRLVIIFVQGIGLCNALHFWHPCINRLKEGFAFLQANGGNFRTKFQIIEFNLFVGILEQEIRYRDRCGRVYTYI